MAGNSMWNQAVKQAFKAGRRSNKKYSLKEAMFDAKKIYKRGKTMAVNSLNYRRTGKKGKKSGYGRRRTRGGNTGTVKNHGLVTGGEGVPKIPGLNGGEGGLKIPGLKGGNVVKPGVGVKAGL